MKRVTNSFVETRSDIASPARRVLSITIILSIFFASGGEGGIEFFNDATKTKEVTTTR